MKPRKKLEALDNEVVLRKFDHHKTKVVPVKESTKQTVMSRLRHFSKDVGKPFAEVTQDDITTHFDGYKPSMKNQILVSLKTFYRWYYDLDKTDKLPDCIREIKPVKITYDEIQYRERIVTETEYQRFLDYAPTPMHKAMTESLFLLGVRGSELCSINSDGVTFDGTFTRVIVWESKTKTREIPHKGRLEHLLKWAETLNPNKGIKGIPLFKTRKKHRWVIDSLDGYFRELTRSIGMRRITPHDFRHTSISRDRTNGVPVTHIETKHGLEHGTGMMRIYDHNKTRDFEEYLSKKDGAVEPTYQELKSKQQEEIKALKEELAIVKEALDRIPGLNFSKAVPGPHGTFTEP